MALAIQQNQDRLRYDHLMATGVLPTPGAIDMDAEHRRVIEEEMKFLRKGYVVRLVNWPGRVEETVTEFNVDGSWLKYRVTNSKRVHWRTDLELIKVAEQPEPTQTDPADIIILLPAYEGKPWLKKCPSMDKWLSKYQARIDRPRVAAPERLAA